jgi:hypothetical protein
MVIAANRAGLWARADGTPFGHGRPYSRGQLGALLSEALFEPTASARALYAPPLDWPLIFALSEGFERAGRLLTPGSGGLVLMEAVKRLYAEAAGDRRKVLLARAPQRAKPASLPPISHLHLPWRRRKPYI